MKSRQKFTVSGKYPSKRFESETDNSLEQRVKKKIASNPLIQKNLNFLHNYSSIFRKPAAHFGDADSYFKKSLRSYEAFDIIRDLNLQSHLVRSAKSFDSLIKRKPRSRQTLLSPRFPNRHSISNLNCATAAAEREEVFVKELFSSEAKEEFSSDKGDSSKFNLKLDEVEEVSEESVTPRFEDSLNQTLDEILKGEEDDMEEGEVFDEGLEDEYNEQEQDGEVVEGVDVGVEGATEEEVNLKSKQRIVNVVTLSILQDDEMAEVGRMIEEASEELDQVAEENKELMQNLQGEGDSPSKQPGGGEAVEGSVFQFNPEIDAAILRELEDAEKQAKETAAVINQLKTRVGELLQKEKMTEVEAKELEEKNKELKAQMILFEEKTKRIQQLIAQSNLFENMIPVKPMLQKKNKEDMLPKVIVCGLQDGNMPTFIVCDGKKKCTPRGQPRGAPETPDGDFLSSPLSPKLPPQVVKKLNECYCMQEKLAAENADLEGKRYKLQSDLLNKDQTVENLQRQLGSLQNEMHMVCQENCLLNQKLQSGGAAPAYSPYGRSTSPNKNKKMPCGKGKGICPADIEARLEQYSENTQCLEKQLGDMEAEVRTMQEELIAVQREREHLEHHRKLLCVPPPCAPAPCYPPPPCGPYPCMPPPNSPSPCECGKGSSDQQLRELKEQYNRLQDDFKGKLTEVAGLRTDNEKFKETAKTAEEAKKTAEAKLKEIEAELKKLKGNRSSKVGGKEQQIDIEQQLTVAKQRFREAQDELEELRALVQDQQGQLDDYRNKYLEAQQQVEEQRRTIDMMEMENQRISEQVNLEIQRVKNQFQEKLTELMPLPDILKSTQMKLQEAQQMHLLAERNNEAIARELQQYKDKLAALTDEMDLAKSGELQGADEKQVLRMKVKELEEALEELREENDKLRTELEQLQEKCDDFERTAEERAHEIIQLESQLENLREETARQVARTKDRCEIVRRSMQNQINDLERQLAQSRALAKAAQKDRDEIRQKMQAQINNLNENFEDAQMRIRNLQGHVNFLKNTYGNVFPAGDEKKG
ncbi:hypothetical protein NQ315_000914 [Exocentrus adspersus]|uniref:Uncharacterized protein n=1 Tax=Exocentrus adspersus TaxID=1586481 RepID=A0AAV8WG95_9CUCU|nr:hypothetical protein NQ315_000914 [Exocentrus adspersus]